MSDSIKKERLPINRIYQLYLEWEATPSSERQPKKLMEFGDMYDISPDDVVEFQSRPTYNEDLMSASLTVAGRRVPRIITSLMESLERDPSKAQNVQNLLKMIKDYGSSTAGVTEFDFKSQLSNTQMREMVKILEEELN